MQINKVEYKIIKYTSVKQLIQAECMGKSGCNEILRQHFVLPQDDRRVESSFLLYKVT